MSSIVNLENKNLCFVRIIVPSFYVFLVDFPPPHFLSNKN